MQRIVCLALLMLFAGCHASGSEPYPVDESYCKVEAAHLIAFARPPRLAPSPAKDDVVAEEPLPEPTPGPVEEAEQAPAPQVVEAQAPAAEPRGGFVEDAATKAIDRNIEAKLSKAGLTWPEIQKLSKALRAFNAANDAYTRVMHESTPPNPLPRRDEVAAVNPKTRCLILSMGAGCSGCVIVKAEATKLAEAKQYTFGNEPTNDIQLVEWNAPGAAELRRKHKATRFPTLVLVTPDGSEVARHVGALRSRELAKWIEDSRRNRAEL